MVRIKMLTRPVIVLVVVLSLAVWSGRERATAPAPESLAIHNQDEGVELAFAEDDVWRLFPRAASLSKRESAAAGDFLVANEAGDTIGWLMVGPPADSVIVGHAGQVPFMMGWDDQGRIIGVVMLASRETPGYARRVEEKLGGAWDGLRVDEAAGREVAAISGATRTSQALLRGVRKSLQARGDGGEWGLERETRLTVAGWWSRGLLLAFWLLSQLSFFRIISLPRHRVVMLGIGVAVAGVVAGVMLSLDIMGLWVQGGFNWLIHWLILPIAVSAFLLPLLTGRNYYCYHYCPFGAAQELVGRLTQRFWHPGLRWRRLFSVMRWLLLGTAGWLLALEWSFSLTWLEPFVVFNWFSAPWFSRGLALVFLGLSLLIPRPWCRICPTGCMIEVARELRVK